MEDYSKFPTIYEAVRWANFKGKGDIKSAVCLLEASEGSKEILKLVQNLNAAEDLGRGR